MERKDKTNLVLDGCSLTIQDIFNLVSNANVTVTLSEVALKKVRAANKFLLAEYQECIIYGVNTGLGPMVSYLIDKNQLADLQVNLIRSHATGMGEPIDSKFSLASMIVRLNTLLQGFSGVSEKLLEQLVTFINYRLLPIIPEHGAVGTSGDLVQLAHIALTLIGEGEVLYEGQRQATGPLLRRLKILPYRLQPKEGLALINGTAVMTGIAALTFRRAKLALAVAVRSGAWALELTNAFSDSFDSRLQAVRPHPGQIAVASDLRKLTRGSKLLKDRGNFQTRHKLSNEVQKISENGQGVYSFRCLPQILGPVKETLESVEKSITIEINSTTDNPIVIASDKVFLHGGNFHGDYIAVAVDQLKIAIAKTTILAERQINYFLNQKLNDIFPPFLNLGKPGLTLGLQGLQFVATSTTAQSQSLSFPHNLHSIPTNGDNQDVVSMGADAALFAHKVIDNALTVLTIELVILAQATDCQKSVKQLSSIARSLFEFVRGVCPAVIDDRPLSDNLARLRTFVESQADKIIAV